MFSRSEACRQGYGQHGASVEPFAVVHPHSHVGAYVYSRGVLQIHDYTLQAVCQHLVAQVAADGSRTASKRQSHRAHSGFSADVCHVGRYLEVVEASCCQGFFGQDERQFHLKASLAVGYGLFGQQFLACAVVAGPPP